MLPATHRLVDGASFRDVTRRGRRASSHTVVTHLLVVPDAEVSVVAVKVGFVVSKAVGGSVVRGRVKRRLRHVVRTELPHLPPGSSLVVRALPASAEASSARLRRDLVSCLARYRSPA
ncbi:ribonuclease P protein component [Nocardioides sp. C4-1]|uniref:ribonuclease P protein component n=1 Tax=Nocardioides sp. C4-1 TaxID=3151851 RepID=UPI00326391B0